MDTLHTFILPAALQGCVKRLRKGVSRPLQRRQRRKRGAMCLNPGFVARGFMRSLGTDSARHLEAGWKLFSVAMFAVRISDDHAQMQRRKSTRTVDALQKCDEVVTVAGSSRISKVGDAHLMSRSRRRGAGAAGSRSDGTPKRHDQDL